jgi:hypothetical protein
MASKIDTHFDPQMEHEMTPHMSRYVDPATDPLCPYTGWSFGSFSSLWKTSDSQVICLYFLYIK